MKTLHIVNWYPSNPTPFNAPWIKNHIDSIEGLSENLIYHIEINKGRFRICIGTNEDRSHYLIIYLPFSVWRINEYLSFLLTTWILLNSKKKNPDIINFHIAYPNCTYLHLLKKWVNCPIVITEHWSAYHFKFKIENINKRKRIQRIFQHKLPIITVSKALAYDIQTFSVSTFPQYILPNIVDTQIFQYKHKVADTNTPTFLMVSQWQWPKNPFIIIKAWVRLIQIIPNAKLEIGGFGEQWKEINNLVMKLNLDDNIILKGVLSKEATAKAMQNATAFIHCSEYETFSVVCAEALCSGTAVIASNVGGIREYIEENNGILVKENNEEHFLIAILEFLKNEKNFMRELIALKAQKMFSSEIVGKKYFEIISNISSVGN